jgi:hypothetical protein
MRAQMGNVETSVGRFPLQIAIGLGSGQLTGVGLGNQDGRDWLLLGAPLAAMGEAQMAAPPGRRCWPGRPGRACSGAVEAFPVDDDFYQVDDGAAAGSCERGASNDAVRLPRS